MTPAVSGHDMASVGLEPSEATCKHLLSLYLCRKLIKETITHCMVSLLIYLYGIEV